MGVPQADTVLRLSSMDSSMVLAVLTNHSKATETPRLFLLPDWANLVELGLPPTTPTSQVARFLPHNLTNRVLVDSRAVRT